MCKSLKIIADVQEHGAIAHGHSGAERCHVALGSFYGIDLHLRSSPSAGLVLNHAGQRFSFQNAGTKSKHKHIKKRNPISFCSFGAGYLSVTAGFHMEQCRYIGL